MQAAWMGQEGFWLYSGYVLPIVCDVWDAHHCLNAVRRVEAMAPCRRFSRMIVLNAQSGLTTITLWVSRSDSVFFRSAASDAS